MAYIIPDKDNINFELTSGYSAPNSTNIIFGEFLKLQDMALDIKLAGDIFDNISLDLTAWYQDCTTIGIDIYAQGWELLHSPLDIQIAKQEIELLILDLQIAKEIQNNSFLELILTDAEVGISAWLDLELTNGLALANGHLDLSCTQEVPIFKAVYSFHLASAIQDIT